METHSNLQSRMRLKRYFLIISADNWYDYRQFLRKKKLGKHDDNSATNSTKGT